jgi:GTP-binding protein
MPLTVAIVGRPNVGKSTLFNKLAGRKLALVHDTPGVTRDRREADATLGAFSFRVIDTAGFEEDKPESMAARMTAQTMTAIADADACIFMFDARAGVTAGDEIIARALRRLGNPVILAGNKCEGRGGDAGLAEGYALGFGAAIALSAEHSLGFGELQDAMEALDTTSKPEPAVTEEFADDGSDVEANDEREARPIHLAIVGRPNVGKSSLFNLLLGEERTLTGPEAGTTRDAIAARWSSGGQEFLLHDTAGLRRKARAAGHTLEEMSVESTLDAIRFADCVVVVLDATQAFEKQDLTIADLIAREGRAIVFVANKFDLVDNRPGTIKDMRERLDNSLPQVVGAPLVAISAQTSEGIERILPAVLEANAAWNKRIGTSTLNRFLENALGQHAPPAVSGRRIRLRYMTQVKARPPTFALFGNQLKALPEDYLRYLTNGLRSTFELKGTPIRFLLRTGKNPFDQDK